MSRSFLSVSFAGWLLLLLPAILVAEEPAALRKQAAAVWEKGDREKGLKLAGEAIAADPKNPTGYLLRGSMYAVLGKHKEAVADLDRCIELNPRVAEAYDRRGSERFKLGDVKGSAADFDRYIALRPKAFAGHWRRGISLYYAGRYDDGRKQFEGYQKFDANDVENAVWHFLCVAKKDGLKKARASLLPIKKDARVPMMEVYGLYAGKLKPEDVLAAARKGKGAARDRQLFYAHLYLGLYYEVAGDKKKAREHIKQAAGKYRIGHYMGDVARVHWKRMKS
jgi:lipoprotein NlpI